ncbi:MAG: AbrB/MazE/SpoVT family DNA-binding domain-containing protein [Deltaproteobacteria bacterium]|nr:AbrB/MazE/SpoVT family DNA-binding domain-containing protein [Deltaproteobacteria bacterium]
MSKVTAKYQITIPPEIRKGLRIKPGMEVDIAKKGEKFELIFNPVEELKKRWRGKYKGRKTADQYLEEIRGPI